MQLTRISNKDIAGIIADLEWPPDDKREAIALTSFTINELLVKQQRIEPITFIVEHEDKILTVISIDIDGNMTYFNTVDVKPVLYSYIKFIKTKLDEYINLFNVELTTDVAAWYTTAVKKLELLGFKQIDRYGDKVTYGKSN